MPSLKVPTVHTHEKEDTTKLGIWIAGITQACSAGCCSFFGLGFLFRCGISKSLILIQIGKESFPKVLFQNNIHLYSFLPSTCFKVNKQWELYWLCVHPWTMLIVAESISPVFMSVLQCYWMSLLPILLHVFLSFSLLQRHVRHLTLPFLLLTLEIPWSAFTILKFLVSVAYFPSHYCCFDRTVPQHNIRC